MLQNSTKELDTRGATAFDRLAQAAQDAVEGVPDKPMDDLTARQTSISALVKPEGADWLYSTKATWKGKPVTIIGASVSEDSKTNYCFRLVGGGDSGVGWSKEL